MDELLKRVDEIASQIPILDLDLDRKQKITKEIDSLNEGLDRLEHLLDGASISEEKFSSSESENLINKTISQYIFPQYWFLDQLLRKMEPDQLKSLQNHS